MGREFTTEFGGLLLDQPNVGRRRRTSEPIKYFIRIKPGIDFTSRDASLTNFGTQEFEYSGFTPTVSTPLATLSTAAQNSGPPTYNDGLFSSQWQDTPIQATNSNNLASWVWSEDCSNRYITYPSYPMVASPEVAAYVSASDAVLEDFSGGTLQFEVEKIGVAEQWYFRQGLSNSCPSRRDFWGWFATEVTFTIRLIYLEEPGNIGYGQGRQFLAIEPGQGTLTDPIYIDGIGPLVSVPRTLYVLPSSISPNQLTTPKKNIYSFSWDATTGESWLHINDSYYYLNGPDSTPEGLVNFFAVARENNYTVVPQVSVDLRVINYGYTAQYLYLDTGYFPNSSVYLQRPAVGSRPRVAQGVSSGAAVRLTAVRFEDSVFLPKENLSSVPELVL